MKDYLSIEHNFFKISTFSLLILTTSLVFFQMTVSKTVEIPKFYAKVFSITLVAMSSIYVGLALYQYHQRLSELSYETEISASEKIYWMFYLSLGILFMLLEICICFVMIGKVKHWKTI